MRSSSPSRLDRQGSSARASVPRRELREACRRAANRGRSDPDYGRRWSRSRMRLEVIDDGPGFSLDAITPEHGLGNLIARLELLFGGAGRLDVTRENDKTVVRISLPRGIVRWPWKPLRCAPILSMTNRWPSSASQRMLARYDCLAHRRQRHRSSAGARVSRSEPGKSSMCSSSTFRCRE